MATAALPALGVDADRYKYKYIIAITVSLASVLELLDTSIVNVAIPHMMGNLGATLDEIAWVSTGYIVANVIILPITGSGGSSRDWEAARCSPPRRRSCTKCFRARSSARRWRSSAWA